MRETELQVTRDGLVLRGTLVEPDLPDAGQPGVSQDRPPLVLLMHGIMANRNVYRFVAIARELAARGVASMRFDLNARGESDGDLFDMTVPGEIADLEAILAHARELGWDGPIGMLGHSQGGVDAALFAGLHPEEVGALVLMSPAAVLQDNCQRGFVPFPGLGPEYARTGAELDIYGTVARYTGPACIIHGGQDAMVPVSYGERFHEVLAGSDLHVLGDDDHALMRNARLIRTIACDFLCKHLLPGYDEGRAEFLDMLAYLEANGIEPNERVRAVMAAFGIGQRQEAL